MIVSKWSLPKEEFLKFRFTNSYAIKQKLCELYDQEKSVPFFYVMKGQFVHIYSATGTPMKYNIPVGELSTMEVNHDYNVGDSVSIRVKVNATISIPVEGKRSTVRGITGTDDLLKWFGSRVDTIGMSVDSLQISRSGVDRLYKAKGNNKITVKWNEVLLKATVTNKEQFEKSADTGIGKSRAFGYGLLRITKNP